MLESQGPGAGDGSFKFLPYQLSMGGGAWPFVVGGVICLANSILMNETLTC